MKLADVPRNPSYYDTYIKQVDDLDLSEAFLQSIAAIDALDLAQLHAIGNRVYAPGKWTLRDLFQHLTDAVGIRQNGRQRVLRVQRQGEPLLFELRRKTGGEARHHITQCDRTQLHFDLAGFDP